MGVLNITPDSFSDGGLYAEIEDAIARGIKMAEDGADIIDIGGESTRPATFRDKTPLNAEIEKQRVIPVIERLSKECPDVPISIDTYKADVAKMALEAGASIVNDISGLSYDADMAPLVAECGCPVVIMHIPGSPRDIAVKVTYNDIIKDLSQYFQHQIRYAHENGIKDAQILIDPGIGFGKNTEINLEIIRRLDELKQLGYPIVLGPSRKRFIGEVLGIDNTWDRKEGTAAAIAAGIIKGASIVRVHDIVEMARVAKMTDAIIRTS